MGKLLSKLGLQLAQGANPATLYIVLAAAVAIVAGGGWTVWYLTDLGKQSALAQCEREKQAAQAEARELETQNREMNRDGFMAYVMNTAKLPPAVKARKDQVRADVEANPERNSCSLDDRELREWNADPYDAPLPIRPGAPGTIRVQPSGGQQRGQGNLAAQSRGLQGNLQGAVAEAHDAGGRSDELHSHPGL